MHLTALNGHGREDAPWRGALVVRSEPSSAGVLLDPTGTLSSRLLMEPELRQSCGLDRPTLPVLLTRAQLDQIAALIELRHGKPIDLYTTPALFDSLSSSAAIWPALQAQCVMHWRMVPLGGDRMKAHFSVEHQAGLAYTALLCGQEVAEESPPVALLMHDQRSGAQVAWVHGATTPMRQAQAVLHDHWSRLQWLALDLGEEDPHEALQWLIRAPVPHKLLLGGDLDVQAHAREAGIVVAHDRLEITVG